MTKHNPGSGAVLELLTGCGWLKKLQVGLLNQVWACGNKQGICTYICVCTHARVHRNSNHICFWSWTTKSATLLLGVPWKEVTECGTLFPSQHSAQLVKREKKRRKRSVPFILPQCCLPPLSSSCRNTSLLGIMLSLCKKMQKELSKSSLQLGS